MTEEHRPTDHTRLSDGLSCKECMTQVIKEASEMQRVELKLLDRKLLISELEDSVKGLESKCTCGCEFGDGCLCRQERDGFNTCRLQALELLKKYKS